MKIDSNTEEQQLSYASSECVSTRLPTGGSARDIMDTMYSRLKQDLDKPDSRVPFSRSSGSRPQSGASSVRVKPPEVVARPASARELSPEQSQMADLARRVEELERLLHSCTSELTNAKASEAEARKDAATQFARAEGLAEKLQNVEVELNRSQAPTDLGATTSSSSSAVDSSWYRQPNGLLLRAATAIGLKVPTPAATEASGSMRLTPAHPVAESGADSATGSARIGPSGKQSPEATPGHSVATPQMPAFRSAMSTTNGASATTPPCVTLSPQHLLRSVGSPRKLSAERASEGSSLAPRKLTGSSSIPEPHGHADASTPLKAAPAQGQIVREEGPPRSAGRPPPAVNPVIGARQHSSLPNTPFAANRGVRIGAEVGAPSRQPLVLQAHRRSWSPKGQSLPNTPLHGVRELPRSGASSAAPQSALCVPARETFPPRETSPGLREASPSSMARPASPAPASPGPIILRKPEALAGRSASPLSQEQTQRSLSPETSQGHYPQRLSPSPARLSGPLSPPASPWRQVGHENGAHTQGPLKVQRTPSGASLTAPPGRRLIPAAVMLGTASAAPVATTAASAIPRGPAAFSFSALV